MNPGLSELQPYPFEKLTALKQGISPPDDLHPIALSIGEPLQDTPDLILEAIEQHRHQVSVYPLTKGVAELRQTIAQWLCKRFNLPPASLDPETQILPVNGTREALFAFSQMMINYHHDSLVLMPNPFYQIYEGAALLAGAKPWYLNSDQSTGFLPDFDAVPDSIWRQCQILTLCSPSNPTGAVLDTLQLQQLIELSLKYDFVIASDECYSELYVNEDQPPPGLLSAASQMGHDSYTNCVVFHSLSKRSNSPSLRSGFVAGDRHILSNFFRYRTYHGCAMPLHHQYASIAAWKDEAHVKANRDLYREKFSAVLDILDPVLDVQQPEAGFYLWPKTPISDVEFTRGLFAEQHVTVIPGSFLSRDTAQGNPGQNRLRIALVGPKNECIEAAKRIRRFCESL